VKIEKNKRQWSIGLILDDKGRSRTLRRLVYMKRTLRILGIVAALIVAIVIALPFVINANQFRPMLESRLTKALGRDVKVGDLKLAVLSGGVAADNLSIAEDPGYGREPFVQAKSLRIGVDLPGLLFSRKLVVTALTIDQPEVVLLQSPSGEWNYSSLGAKSAAPAPAAEPGGKSNMDLSVKLVKIANGRFTLGRAGSRLKPVVLEKVNAELHDFSAATTFPFSFSAAVAGGGAIVLEGKAGPIDPADAAMTPVSLTVNVNQLDLAGTGLNEMAPWLAGVVSFEGGGSSDGRILQLTGKLKADKIKLAPHGFPAKRLVELDFKVAHDLKKRSGTVHRGDIHLGGAISSLTGTYAAEGESTRLKMSLSGSQLALPELAEMLPPLGLALPMGSSLQGGTATLKVGIEGPLDHLVTEGSVSINKTRLTGFDLPKRMASIERLAGIRGGPDTEIEVLSINMRMAPDGMSANDIQLVLPAMGDLKGGGTISPESALKFEMLASVHTSGLARLVNDTPIPFTVEGTCSQPVFKPNLKAVLKEEIKSVGGDVEKAAGGLLKDLFGRKKK
jgi:AsmA protein